MTPDLSHYNYKIKGTSSAPPTSAPATQHQRDREEGAIPGSPSLPLGHGGRGEGLGVPVQLSVFYEASGDEDLSEEFGEMTLVFRFRYSNYEDWHSDSLVLSEEELGFLTRKEGNWNSAAMKAVMILGERMTEWMKRGMEDPPF